MWVFWVILVLLLIYAALLFFKKATPLGDSGNETAEQVLRRRYARGEIDRREYERKRQQLRG